MPTMSTNPSLISALALIVSMASFGLSVYVYWSNAKFLLAKTRSDLLIKIDETRMKYKELNRRYHSIASNAKSLTPKNLDMLVQYKEFEKNTEMYFKDVRTRKFSLTELEELRYRIEGLLFLIAIDERRIDDWEKEEKQEKG